MRLSKGPISTKQLLLTVGLLMAAYFVSGLGEAQPPWICTTYKIDYTAVAIVAAIATFLLERRERLERLMASRKAVQSLAVLELQILISAMGRMFRLLPREEVPGLEVLVFTAEDIWDAGNLQVLKTEVDGLATPILNSLIEKLDALPGEDLAKIGDISNQIARLKLSAEELLRLTSGGSKSILMGPTAIESMLDQCQVLATNLVNLRDKWNDELQGLA